MLSTIFIRFVIPDEYFLLARISPSRDYYYGPFIIYCCNL